MLEEMKHFELTVIKKGEMITYKNSSGEKSKWLEWGVGILAT